MLLWFVIVKFLEMEWFAVNWGLWSGVVSRETREWTRYMDFWKLYYIYHGFNTGVPRFTSCD